MPFRWLNNLYLDFQETPNWFWSDAKYQREDTDVSVAPTTPPTPRDLGDEENLSFHLPQVTENENNGKTLALAAHDRLDDDGADSKEAPREQVYIVKEGWMMKQGGFVRNWKRRWFELVWSTLIVFSVHFVFE